MSEYRVLARKYRPQTFDDLIGQDVLVRTLTNAIERNRLAHAFVLTGIRGIGKTTTARILARALNCIGADGQGGATPHPCGTCANCTAIAEDRHVDVMEMDAASRTGVDDIRDLIDTVHYAPTNARYKIYIIDEVHMLSKNAFNALLKTLEEPPPHVKFIFATTEIRKIPVTILSRCQRFDLKRVDIETLVRHLSQVSRKEQAAVEEDALKLVAGAAEGSVRDALSLLDQAIAHSEGTVTADIVRSMLGLVDKSLGIALLEHTLAGQPQAALAEFDRLYEAGADPVLLLQDLLELVHYLSRLKASGQPTADYTLGEAIAARCAEMATQISVPALARAWQMLLKGLQEARTAPNPVTAMEMLLIRLAHAADLPPPAEIIRSLQQGSHAPAGSAPIASPPGGARHAPATASTATYAAQGNTALASSPQAVSVAQPETYPAPTIARFEDVLALMETKREPLLYAYLYNEARLVSFQRGRIELNLSDVVPADAAGRVARLLSEWTGERWMISLSKNSGQPSLQEQENARFEAQKARATEDSRIARVLEMFPGAVITCITEEGA